MFVWKVSGVCEKSGSIKMWNGKCHRAKEPPPGPVQIQNNLNVRNGSANDTCSMRSVSSEDISTSDLPSTCCSSNATNPAIKSGRRFQLLQVSFRLKKMSIDNGLRRKLVHPKTFEKCANVCLKNISDKINIQLFGFIFFLDGLKNSIGRKGNLYSFYYPPISIDNFNFNRKILKISRFLL